MDIGSCPTTTLLQVGLFTALLTVGLLSLIGAVYLLLRPGTVPATAKAPPAQPEVVPSWPARELRVFDTAAYRRQRALAHTSGEESGIRARPQPAATECYGDRTRSIIERDSQVPSDDPLDIPTLLRAADSAQVSHLLSRGRSSQATVTSVRSLLGVEDDGRGLELSLTVDSDCGVPFEALARELFASEQRYSVGDRVTVRYDPRHPSFVAIDRPRSQARRRRTMALGIRT